MEVTVPVEQISSEFARIFELYLSIHHQWQSNKKREKRGLSRRRKCKRGEEKKPEASKERAKTQLRVVLPLSYNPLPYAKAPQIVLEHCSHLSTFVHI